MADGLSAVAANALPRAMASGSWFGRRKPTAPSRSGTIRHKLAPTKNASANQILARRAVAGPYSWFCIFQLSVFLISCISDNDCLVTGQGYDLPVLIQ